MRNVISVKKLSIEIDLKEMYAHQAQHWQDNRDGPAHFPKNGTHRRRLSNGATGIRDITSITLDPDHMK